MRGYLLGLGRGVVVGAECIDIGGVVGGPYLVPVSITSVSFSLNEVTRPRRPWCGTLLTLLLSSLVSVSVISAKPTFLPEGGRTGLSSGSRVKSDMSVLRGAEEERSVDKVTNVSAVSASESMVGTAGGGEVMLFIRRGG